MALFDHGSNIPIKLQNFDSEVNCLKVPLSSYIPLSPVENELVRRTDKVLNNLQTLTRSFQSFRASIINQLSDLNKENSNQNSFSYEKLSPFLKSSSAPNLQLMKSQMIETIDYLNDFLKSYCPKTSFEVCLDQYSLQETSSHMRSPFVLRGGAEVSPTLEFSKITDQFKARTNVKSKTHCFNRINRFATSPDHYFKPALHGNGLFSSNYVDDSPVARLFDDISPIGCFINNGTFTHNYNSLANPIPIGRISEFNCESEVTDESKLKTIEEVRRSLKMLEDADSGIVNETDYQLKSNEKSMKSYKEMSTEFSIEIEVVKVEVQEPHLDENGNEMLLFGLNSDE